MLASFFPIDLNVIVFLPLIVWLFWIIYNIYLSPLRSIPGPIQSQIIPFYDYYYMVKGEFHIYLSNLHEIYGPTIRIGGDKVVFNHPDSWKEIHSTYKFPKTPFYNHMRTVGWSMITINNKEEHSSRRRAVSKTFSETNIIKLEKVVVEVGTSVLLKKLEDACKGVKSGSIDLSKNFLFLTYDVIGKLVFSENFNILQQGHHKVLDWNRKLVVWIILNVALPPIRLIGNPYFKNVAMLAKKSIERRKEQIKNNEKVPDDILGGLINAKDPNTGNVMNMSDLMEECAELLVAGSDTTAHTLTWILFTLLKHPKAKKRLVEEIDSVFPDLASINYKDCQKNLPYFQAVLKEVMRLYPVGSHPLLRSVPEQGAVLDGYAIPGNTEIITNCYSLHHSSSYWNFPNSFLPERWLKESEGRLDMHKQFNHAYQPFISGPRSCVGRYLAMLEMTLTIVMLFKKFDLDLVDPKLDLNPVCYISLHPKAHEPLLVSFKLRV